MFCPTLVSEVVQTLQLCANRDESDVVGDLSVCLDGMSVDPEMFAKAKAEQQSKTVEGQFTFNTDCFNTYVMILSCFFKLC